MQQQYSESAIHTSNTIKNLTQNNKFLTRQSALSIQQNALYPGSTSSLSKNGAVSTEPIDISIVRDSLSQSQFGGQPNGRDSTTTSQCTKTTSSLQKKYSKQSKNPNMSITNMENFDMNQDHPPEHDQKLQTYLLVNSSSTSTSKATKHQKQKKMESSQTMNQSSNRRSSNCTEQQFKQKVAEKARSKQRNLLVASAQSSHTALNLKFKENDIQRSNKSPVSSRRTSQKSQSRSLSKSAKTKTGRLNDFQTRLDNLESEQQELQRSMQLGRSSIFDTKHYGQVARENVELQQAYQKKCAQLEAMAQDYQRAQQDLSLVQQKLKKLKYENEKLYQDCQRLRTTQSDSDSFQFQSRAQKMILKEVECFEYYQLNFYDLLKTTNGTTRELTIFKNQLQQSLQALRDYIMQPLVNLKDNQQQQQTRISQTKEAYTQLLKISQVGTAFTQKLRRSSNSRGSSRIRELEKQLESEKSEHAKKLNLYKDQVSKMKENMKLFKESINQLQLKNQELQTSSLLQSSVNGQISQSELQQMGLLFTGLKEDNTRLATEIRRLVEENNDLKENHRIMNMKISEQHGVIIGLQSVLRQLNPGISDFNQNDQQQRTHSSRSLHYETAQGGVQFGKTSFAGNTAQQFAQEARFYTHAPLQSHNKSEQLNASSRSVSPQPYDKHQHNDYQSKDATHQFSVHELSVQNFKQPSDHNSVRTHIATDGHHLHSSIEKLREQAIQLQKHTQEGRNPSQFTESFYLNVIDESKGRSKSSLLDSRSNLDLQQNTTQRIQTKNQCRINIKSNTRQLKNEIQSIDEEIAELQETINGGSILMATEIGTQTQSTNQNTQNNTSRRNKFDVNNT